MADNISKDVFRIGKYYQKVKNNPYLLPKTLYMSMVYTIADYERAVKVYSTLATISPGTKMKSEYYRHIKAVECALENIPQEYRQQVYESIAFNKATPEDIPIKLFKVCRAKFVWEVAKELNYI